ncbi:hypothetical protein EDD70_1931 [Hydrogenoanaerobacterium saccharovorans]|uniref:Uncharacterized protein n=1 Tax=Hydrogenoanaerobacterium saccharovorans TaxID=474960 RepID=A0A1H7YRU1_9FIRM|nr:iron-containing alcohol dehydrogenase [Hydrogenoanaerobacterium saccharovorans]RPF49093.1 hypothetical protein EDD70_1931 [Hydrogenoanaerobacterium saccharovorans]SEM48008.1 hypothetical protein SAMN05216180_0164 [Hydrogenoanaerobacterium saccharovorans]
MINFTYYNPARIIFGKGTEDQVGSEMKKLGSRVLFVYGGGSIKRIGLYDKVVKALNDAGIYFTELSGVKPNPRLGLVNEGIRLCKEQKLDSVLVVGGGSSIDTGKAVAAGALYNGDVWDFFEGKADVQQALPVGVVLTIPAAGSESSDGSVITKEDGLLKRSFGSEHVIPKFAIMNPEFTYSLPDYQTACGASDILAHLMERYFTKVDHVDFTDRLIEATMKTIINNTPLVLANPTDYHARAEVMWAGTVAHNNLLNTGRIGDWASHHIEHELSAIYDIAHGAGLAIVFPAWQKYVCHEDMDRFVQFAVRVFDVDFAFGEKELIVAEGIRRLERWYKEIGMPTRLSDVSIDDKNLRIMAEKCCANGPDGNFKKLTADDVYEIYKLAL